MIISWTCARCKKYVKGSDVGNCPHCYDYRVKNEAPYGYIRKTEGLAQRSDIEMRLSTHDKTIDTFQEQIKEKELNQLKDDIKNIKPRRDRIDL